MKKFMLIYHMPASAMASVEHTPESREEGMKQWFDWKDKMGDKLLDFGSPLGGGVKLIPDGGSKESNSDVAGYSIIQANSKEEAKSLLSDHPHLGWNADCDIELFEFMDM